MNLHKYRLRCTTDDVYEYVWGEEGAAVPTLCPTNSAHTVDSSATTIVGSKFDNEVAVIEEPGLQTGKHFQTTSYELALTNSIAVYSMQISWPMPVSLLSAHWRTDAAHTDDIGQFIVASGTTIGVLTADTSGVATLDVDQDVINNTAIG